MQDGTARKSNPRDSDDGLEGLEIQQDWDRSPALYWQSSPLHEVSLLPSLHSRTGISGALRDQKVLRSTGFNFEDSTGRLKTFEGGLYLDRTRCALWVRPDGVVTSGALATPEMLCWAMEQRNLPQRLNVLVLTEMTLEYFRIADEIVIPQVHGTWRHRISAHGFLYPVARMLGPGGSGADHFLSDASPASTDFWEMSWPAVGDAERDAYEALLRIYTLFGVDVATNPVGFQNPVAMVGLR